ncbi:MAG: hypothetical protein JWO56_1540 [Acidobacteria bacterium]|nr:hypothetical protein [Acidobacteriota bacterium]
MEHDLTGVPVARTFRRRLAGLIGGTRREELFLLIPRCTSVHTFFMRIAIDIVFLNGASRVVDIVESAPPWGLHFGPRGTRHVLELPGGEARAAGIREGDAVRTAYKE